MLLRSYFAKNAPLSPAFCEKIRACCSRLFFRNAVAARSPSPLPGRTALRFSWRLSVASVLAAAVGQLLAQSCCFAPPGGKTDAFRPASPSGVAPRAASCLCWPYGPSRMAARPGPPGNWLRQRSCRLGTPTAASATVRGSSLPCPVRRTGSPRNTACWACPCGCCAFCRRGS